MTPRRTPSELFCVLARDLGDSRVQVEMVGYGGRESLPASPFSHARGPSSSFQSSHGRASTHVPLKRSRSTLHIKVGLGCPNSSPQRTPKLTP